MSDWDCLGCLGYIDEAGSATDLTASRSGYPSLLQQANNVVTAAARFAQSGFKTASRMTIEARLAVCQVCESLDAPHGRCFECGCYVGAKTRMASEECPLGKW